VKIFRVCTLVDIAMAKVWFEVGRSNKTQWG